LLDVSTGVTTMVYDGWNNPNLLSYNCQNLKPGNRYGFSVVAFNFNGKGEASEIIYFGSCTAPYGQPDPILFLNN